MLIWTQRLWQQTQDRHKSKPDKVPARRRRIKHKAPSLAKKLFAVALCWEKGNHISLVEWHCVYQSHSRQASCPWVLSQYKTDSMFFVCFILMFLKYFYFLFVCLFILTFWFFFERKNTEAGRLGRWDELGRERMWSEYTSTTTTHTQTNWGMFGVQL